MYKLNFAIYVYISSLGDIIHENVMHTSGKCGQHLANNQSAANFPVDFNQQVVYLVIGHSGAVIIQNDHRQSGLAAYPNQ